MILRRHKPKSWWVEEVVGFGSTGLAKYGGRIALEVCTAEWVKLGYSVRSLVMNHDVWVAMTRERLFIIAVSEKCGGARAADWMINFLVEAIAQRRMSPPLSVWDIVLPEGHDEVSRRPEVEELFFCENPPDTPYIHNLCCQNEMF